MTIKAIETSYKGYRFRSRLEARWAVFFDALGLEWEYEKQGYSLHSGTYLPDFWVHYEPHGGRPKFDGAWFEIKPIAPTPKEWSLLCELSIYTGRPAYSLSGPPRAGEFGLLEVEWMPWICRHVPFEPTPEGIRKALLLGDEPGLAEASDDTDNRLRECPNPIIHFAARQANKTYLSPTRYGYGKDWDLLPPMDFLLELIGSYPPELGESVFWTNQNVNRAFDAASSARFEHGETPR